jgi:hypothetical protein
MDSRCRVCLAESRQNLGREGEKWRVKDPLHATLFIRGYLEEGSTLKLSTNYLSFLPKFAFVLFPSRI